MPITAPGKTMESKNVCEKCGVIHDVELAGGHDLIESDKVLRCECADHPDDEFCREVLRGACDNSRTLFTNKQYGGLCERDPEECVKCGWKKEN
jgi:hypothetical protein